MLDVYVLLLHCFLGTEHSRSRVRRSAKPVPRRARGVNQLFPSKIGCQLRCPWVSAQAGRFFTGPMEDPWFSTRKAVADTVDSRAFQTAWHVWTVGLYPSVAVRRKMLSASTHLIAQWKLSSFSSTVILFLLEVSLQVIFALTSIILQGVCKIFALSLLSCHFATGIFFFSPPTDWRSSGKEKREQKAEQSCVLVV